MVDVNKPTLLVAGGGFVALVVIAVLVGAALTQPDAPVVGDESTPTAQQATSLPTLEPTASEPSAGTDEGTTGETASPTPYPTLTPTPTPTATPTATPELTDVPAESFDEQEIERLVGEYLNERRAEEDLQELEHRGEGVEGLIAMARGHSVRMADIDEAIHRIDGQNSADRYRSNDLYERCRWSAPDGNSLVTADRNALEAVHRTVAGEPYRRGGERQFNGDERAVAEAVVDSWWNSSTYRPRVTRPNADQVGVGIEITRRGDVFATANFC